MIHDPFTATIRAAVEPLVQEIASLKAEVADLRDAITDKVPDPERNWNYGDVARKCGVSRGAVSLWVHLGLLEKVDVDGRPCIPDREVRRLMKNGNRPAFQSSSRQAAK